MLNRFKGILENVVVYEDTMKDNIYKTNGVIFAQRVMNALIENNRNYFHDNCHYLKMVRPTYHDTQWINPVHPLAE